MLKNIFLWILTNIFKVETQTTQKELDNNQKYASEYTDTSDINFNAIFSNKLANYTVNDSELIIDGDNQRQDLLNKVGQSMWKKAKKIISMAFGYGGVLLVPYVKGGKLYYNLVPQNRLTIDETDGDYITGATVLAERKEIQNITSTIVYLRWTNYKIEGTTLIITQQFTDERGNKIPVPEFWSNIQEEMKITNVDRALFGYIKSPINNRTSNDNYGVPVTYGCEKTINEIRETLAQIQREYDLKQAFVGADSTMFNGKDSLPLNGLFKKIDSGKDDFFEVFDPEFRDFTIRLEELYRRLEHEVGTSYGIISKNESSNATATEIKRGMYDTFVIIDSMRTNIEKGLEDFFYSCNVLANAYNLSANGDYDINFNWDYSLIEDSTEEFNQLVTGLSNGVVSKEELRMFLNPTETPEEAEEKIAEIKANNPTLQDLIGTSNFNTPETNENE